MSRASKRSYKWCGDSKQQNIEDFASTTKGEVIILCPLVGINDYSDVVLERTLVHFSIRRQTGAELQNLNAMVAVQPADKGDITRPSNTLDPTSSTAQDFSAKNILRWGSLAVPPVVIIPSTDVSAAGLEVFVTEWDIPVKRRLDRERELLTLTVAVSQGDSNVLSMNVMWRCLLSYGKR